jgi:hypothetical protein
LFALLLGLLLQIQATLQKFLANHYLLFFRISENQKLIEVDFFLVEHDKRIKVELAIPHHSPSNPYNQFREEKKKKNNLSNLPRAYFDRFCDQLNMYQSTSTIPSNLPVASVPVVSSLTMSEHHYASFGSSTARNASTVTANAAQVGRIAFNIP